MIEGFDPESFVTAVLAEDLGEGRSGGGRDLTSEAVIPAEARFAGAMVAREPLVVAGLPLAAAFFTRLDPDCRIAIHCAEGQAVAAGSVLLTVEGRARALLTAERSALNSVQHLTGIATLTRRYVEAIAGTGAVLLDTRKTLPGLRLLEKYATRMGGAQNHRLGLWDAVMLKDNHLAVAGGVGPAVARARTAGAGEIILEVDRLDQIEEGIAAGATRLLLDNMDVPLLRAAVALVAGRVPTEASGGIDLTTIRAKADTGVDFLSVGRITQSAPAADIGLDLAIAPGEAALGAVSRTG